MKLRRVIKNAVIGKSVVQKFDAKEGFSTPLQEVIYAMPPLAALTHYYMQFVMRNFKFEDYPKYISGTKKSNAVSGIYYIDMGDTVLRSSPYTGGRKWEFKSKPKKSKLPDKKKPRLKMQYEKPAVVNIAAYRKCRLAEKCKMQVGTFNQPLLAAEAKRKPKLKGKE